MDKKSLLEDAFLTLLIIASESRITKSKLSLEIFSKMPFWYWCGIIPAINCCSDDIKYCKADNIKLKAFTSISKIECSVCSTIGVPKYEEEKNHLKIFKK